MKEIIKKGLYLLSIFALAGTMASCLGGYDEEGTYPLTDAELLNFMLYNDSLPELAKVIFSIDHNYDGAIGAIYNYDSMTYMTEIPEKVLVKYISGAGYDNVLNITNGDSIWVKQGDSIDISTPLLLEVHALNGVTKKLYNVQLNIHQVDPDSLQYIKIASDLSFLQIEDSKTVIFNNRFMTYSRMDGKIQLYSSQSAEKWTYESVSGLPDNAVIKGIQSSGDRLFAYTDNGELYVRYDVAVDQWIPVNIPSSIKIKSIMGYLKAGPKQIEGLSFVIETGGINTFAFTGDFIQWDYDNTTPIPADFPLYDFSTQSHTVMLTERITIFGGISLDGTVRNSVWSTETGRYWAKLTSNMNVFPPIKGANVFYYNQEFWLINGKTDDGYNDKIYYSIDYGVTWRVKFDSDYLTYPDEESEKVDDNKIPDIYPLRYNASIVMDKDNKYFYIIGGKQDAVFTEVWKGFLNKMEFKH